MDDTQISSEGLPGKGTPHMLDNVELGPNLSELPADPVPREGTTTPAKTSPGESETGEKQTETPAKASDEAPAVTFDEETDKKNGYDVESEEYKHFQAAFTKARQRDKGQVSNEVATLREELARLKGEVKATSADSDDGFKIDASQFNPTVPLTELISEEHVPQFKQVLGEFGNFVLGQVEIQSERRRVAAERQAREQLADEYRRVLQQEDDPDVTLALMEVAAKRHPDLFNQPDKLLREARKIGNLPAESTMSEEELLAKAREQLAAKAKNRITRPTVPSTTKPDIPEGAMNTRDAIKLAMREQGLRI